MSDHALAFALAFVAVALVIFVVVSDRPKRHLSSKETIAP